MSARVVLLLGAAAMCVVLVLVLDLFGPPRAATPAAPSAAVSSSRMWTVVGLGDSITSGEACPGCTPFVDLYGREISRDTEVPTTVINLGVGGSTSDDLLESLAEGEAATAVRDADIVTVTIGANDFFPDLDTYLSGECGGDDNLACFTPVLPELQDHLTATLQRIRELRAGQPTAVRVTGYWDVFLDGEVAAQTYGPSFRPDSSALTREVNAVIEEVTRSQDATYVDLFAPFKGEDGDLDPTPLLAEDGEHPNQDGHQQIADSLVHAGYAPLPAGP